jgi:hypothetical protein
MMDMVRKHCTPGTGNHNAAQACVDRTHEMLRMFKEATRNFVSPNKRTSQALPRVFADNASLQVPPQDNLDRVPLGASSASVYPGYSPADHIYGEAAAEYGAMIAEARRQGKEIKSDPDGIEYVVGQSQLSAREQLEKVKKSFAAKKARQGGETSKEVEREQENGEPMEGVEQTADASQLFMVDSNPTPVHILQNKPDASFSKSKNEANDKTKRRVSGSDEQVQTACEVPEDSHKRKRAKPENAGQAVSDSKPLVEEDDISAEVDQRLKEKEERRRRKAEKKRKRESGSSQVAVEGATNVRAEELQVEKPEKKKHKKDRKLEETKKPEPALSEEGKSKKEKKKKRSSTDGDGGEANDVRVEDEKPKKKRRESKEAAASK